MTNIDSSIISREELEFIFEELEMQSKQTKLNPYDIYIQQLRNTENIKISIQKLERNKNFKADQKNKFEKHHIIPRHSGGSNDPSNIVLVTKREHLIAHWIRWKVFDEDGDYRAFLFRKSIPGEVSDRQIQNVLISREIEKELRIRFFSSEFQREMGKRGGAKKKRGIGQFFF